MKSKYVITFLSDCYDIDGGYKTFKLEYAGNRQKEALNMLTHVFEDLIHEEQQKYSHYELSQCPAFKIDRYKLNDKNNIIKRLTFSLIGHSFDKNYYIIDLIEIPLDAEIDERLFMDNPEKVSAFSPLGEIKRFFEPFYAIVKRTFSQKRDLFLVNPSSIFYSNVISFKMGYSSKEAEILQKSTIVEQTKIGELHPHSHRKLCNLDSLMNKNYMFGYYGDSSRTIRSVSKYQIQVCQLRKEQYLPEIKKRGIKIDHTWTRFPDDANK